MRPSARHGFEVALGAMLVALSLASAVAAWAGPLYREVFVVLALAMGAAPLLVWARGRVTTRFVLVVAVLARLAVLWLPPTLSDDVYRYVWDGLVQLDGTSPYAHAPRDAALAELRSEHGDLYGHLNSAGFYSVYPPLSQLLFAASATTAQVGASPLVAVYLLKLLLAAAEIGALLLLSRLVPARLLVLYAWHPLAVIESAGQAHGEALAALLILTCVYTVPREKPLAAGAALGGAVMVKLWPLALLPLLWRRAGVTSMLAASAVMLALALPYASVVAAENVQRSLALYVGLFEFNALPYFLLRDGLNALEPSEADMGKAVVGQLLQTAFALSLPVLVLLDWRRRRPLDRAFAGVIGVYLVCTTTLHPWYMLPLLILPATLGAHGGRPRWCWLWLGLMSVGTYVRYRPGGEATYEAFVWLGWGGWLVLLIGDGAADLLQGVLRRRGRRKAERVGPHLAKGGVVLDLGAGEGYVGLALQKRLGGRAVLADVSNAARVPLAAVHYDGRRLPFATASFDGVALCYVLHHCERPGRVLAEAMRVCRPGGRVVVVESVYRTGRGRRLLRLLDWTANALRGHVGGPLHHRRAAAWRGLADRLGGRVVAFEAHGHPPHRQATVVVEIAHPLGPQGPEAEP